MPSKAFENLGFVALNDTVYLREPTESYPSSRPPHTILLLAWMSAAPKVVQKYASRYISMYPASRLLLCISRAVDFIITSPHVQQQRLIPVVETLVSSASESPTADYGLLVHAFSNGGANTLVQLSRAYRKKTGSQLPVTATILDSSPGRGKLQDSVAGFSTALPTNPVLYYPGVAVVYAILLTTWAILLSLGKKAVVQEAYSSINDPALLSTNSKRCYIFGKEDKIVTAQDVEHSIAEAKARGWSVESEIFVGSKHVGHAVKNPERYWTIVKHIYDESHR